MFIKDANILDAVSVRELQDAAKLCDVSLKVRNGRHVVPQTKAELKEFLKYLSEDFLESPIRPTTIYEVSSKRRRSA